MAHKPVLLQESIESLAIKPNGIYVDGTFGRGGHSQAILKELSPKGRLLAIDKDQCAIEFAKDHLMGDPRFQIIQGSFSHLADFAKAQGIYKEVDGILLDLGVSSPQLDEPIRGFSFIEPGPLDMRMDNSQGPDAAHFVNETKAAEMAKIFREYGEERFAMRIANAIVKARETKPIQNTIELAEIIKAANPKWEKHKHPATRVFQAIRIHINHELSDLKIGLHQALDCLAIGGRLSVISFHSLEDRIVKHFMRQAQEGNRLPLGVPVRAVDIISSFKCIGRAIKPKEEEIKNNSRSRSAVLRIGEKIA